MSIFDKLFGKKAGDSGSKSKGKPYFERDNRGTRQDQLGEASAYWMARNVSQKFDPFVMYVFEDARNAQAAFLELDVIKLASDSGKLICTEPLIYGYYRTESGKYEAILCGNTLTHELWAKAKDSFARHGGVRKNDQEPEKTAAPAPKMDRGDSSKVKFVREDRQVRMGHTMIYRIHKAPNAASAMAFLQQNPVSRQLYYIVVETPEGNYCRDIDGIYKE